MTTGGGLAARARRGGGLAGRSLRELAANSGHFPFLLALLECLRTGPAAFFAQPAHWALLAAAAVQAVVLARMEAPGPRALFLGNVSGVGFYTAVDVLGEGMEFFEGPEHAAYWVFSLALGVLQAGAAAAGTGRPRWRDAFRVAEGTVRTMIFPAVYFLGEMWSKGQGVAEAAGDFFTDAIHVFLTVSFLIIGVLYGVSDALLARHRGLLLLLVERLRRYSSWFVDAGLLESLVESEGRSAPERAERAILFMDIRGFTRWSSARGGAEVGEMLNGYYDRAGPVIAARGGMMCALTGDEVMAIFRGAPEAVACARALQEAVGPYLAGFGLGAGVGVHFGEVLEGLFGTSNRKVYSAMGMPVNVAKRLEGCAGGGAIVVSEGVRRRAGGLEGLRLEELAPVSLKGVPEPVRMYALAPGGAEAPPGEDGKAP